MPKKNLSFRGSAHWTLPEAKRWRPLDAHLTVIKCLKPLSLMELRPWTYANYAPLASLALLCLVINTLAPPPPPHTHTLKIVTRGLHVTCKSGGDADFSLPLPLIPNAFAYYATAPSSIAFLSPPPPPPPGHEKKSPPLV